MTSPVNLHPKIEGVWARQIASFGEVKIEHAWPHGNASASWAFPAGTSHRALHAGASVEIYDGGVRVWKGVLQEPGLDGAMSARGLWTEGEDALALNGDGVATSWPKDAVDIAKGRGALTWGDTSALAPDGPTSTDTDAIFSVAGLLDAWAAKAGKRWGLDPNGNVVAYADPTTPSWHVPHAAAGRGLTPADDDFATHLYGIYLVADDTRAFVSVGDSAAQTAYGRRVERTVDLTNLGPIDATTATATLQNTLNLSAARLRFADGLDLRAGQITTPGGAPAPLSQVRAGQVVRLHGVKDPRGVNGVQNYTDVLIGKSVFDSSTQTLSIAPVDAATRGLGGALASGSGAASSIPASTGTDTGWIALTPMNGWTNYGGGNAPIAVRRKGGVVYLRGLLGATGPGNVAVTNLPEGFRPYPGYSTGIMAPSVSQGGTATAFILQGNGDVVHFQGSGVWYSLGGISFPVDG